jgi:hypothetical protein
MTRLATFFALLLAAGCQGSPHEACDRPNQLDDCTCANGDPGERRCANGQWGACDCRLGACDDSDEFESCYQHCGLDADCGRYGRCAQTSAGSRTLCAPGCVIETDCPVPVAGLSRACLAGLCALRCDPAASPTGCRLGQRCLPSLADPAVSVCGE